MTVISAFRISPVLSRYEVIFRGEGKSLQDLLKLVKIGAQWNSTVQKEIDPANIDEVINQIANGK